MLDLNTIVSTVTMVLLAVGGYLLYLLRAGTEAAAKTGAEEAVKKALNDLHWPVELAQELQKTRGVERQELRYKSYGLLWKELRPLAIYDATKIDKKAMSDLSLKLSAWYFSECGGLLLTPQSRDFYFALQDLLRATSSAQTEWSVDRSNASAADQKVIFHDVLTLTKDNAREEAIKEKIEEAINAFDYFRKGDFKDWQDKAATYGEKWRDGIKVIAGDWNTLNEKERFATLQQVGSILRTSLTIDLDSRLR